MNDSLIIQPFQTPARGVAQVPGSKSITNRALILAALAEGETVLTGALFSRDTKILIAALRELGFEVAVDEPALVIRVRGLGGLIPKSSASLHVGNAGTAARFLTAFLALAPGGKYFLDGDEAMRARPMAGLLAALSHAGCRALQADGTPATGFPFTLTSRMCAQFGRPIRRDTDGRWVCDHSGPYLAPQPSYAIEPDATAASYFIALPAVTGPRASVRIHGYADGGLQGDTAFAKVAATCGAVLRPSHGTLVTQSWAGIQGGDFDFNAFSDTFLTLAVLATLATQPIKIRGIAHTRKQET
ncbi:MAG: hypothetical protein EBS64_11490, partial [Verrucomicrobia bacterium]|nr:hypothetical protein [Verrucomicrobiota bacterium]